MARLIDPERYEAVLNRFEEHLTEFGKLKAAEAVRSLIKGLKIAPTVDAVEVVHGYTLIADEPKKVLLDRKCGICDQLMLATDNYCPMCGAMNDGERKDNG